MLVRSTLSRCTGNTPLRLAVRPTHRHFLSAFKSGKDPKSLSKPHALEPPNKPNRGVFDALDPSPNADGPDHWEVLQDRRGLKEAASAGHPTAATGESGYLGLDGEFTPAEEERKAEAESLADVRLEDAITSLGGPRAMTIKGVVFDTKGHVTKLDQEFQRAQFCAENSLQPRDLRKLDSSLRDQSQVILVRDKSILVNLAHIRALVRADRVVLVSSPSDSPQSAENQSSFIYDFQGKLQVTRDGTYFETKVLETMLSSVTASLKAELDTLEREAERLLASVDAGVDGERLKRLLLMRRAYNKFMAKVDGFREAVNELLINDEDLAGMYLSDKANGKPHVISDHIDMELMLEHYAKLGDDIKARIMETTNNLQTTQHMIGIILDSQRNELIIFDLQANLATAAISCAALLAALLGMNVPNGIDDVPFMFGTICIGSVGLAGAVYFGAVYKMTKIIQWKGLLDRMKLRK